MGLFSKKKAAEPLSYDREKEYPVLHCSIFHGEQVAEVVAAAVAAVAVMAVAARAKAAEAASRVHS